MAVGIGQGVLVEASVGVAVGSGDGEWVGVAVDVRLGVKEGVLVSVALGVIVAKGVDVAPNAARMAVGQIPVHDAYTCHNVTAQKQKMPPTTAQWPARHCPINRTRLPCILRLFSIHNCRSA